MLIGTGLRASNSFPPNDLVCMQVLATLVVKADYFHARDRPRKCKKTAGCEWSILTSAGHYVLDKRTEAPCMMLLPSRAESR